MSWLSVCRMQDAPLRGLIFTEWFADLILIGKLGAGVHLIHLLAAAEDGDSRAIAFVNAGCRAR